MTLKALSLLLIFLPFQENLAKKLLQEGDAHYAKREQDGMARKAIEAYQKAIAVDENDAEAYWKIALSCYWLGPKEQDADRRLALYQEAIDYCKMAIAIDENCIAAHFWLGVMYGVYGESKGILQSLNLVDPIIKEMEWVLKKDESYEKAGAHRVLGRVYFKLPGISGGDIERSKKHLLRSMELAPKNLLNHLYLADVYLYEGKKEDAKKCLRKMLNLEDEPDEIPESKEQKEEGRKLLESLEK